MAKPQIQTGINTVHLALVFFSDKITCLLTYNLRNAIIKVACNSIFKQSYFPRRAV